MTRQQHGAHVYDSDTDTWTGPFNSEDEARAFTHELANVEDTTQTFEQAAPIISAYNYAIVGTLSNTPMEVVGFNPARIACRFNYVGTGTLLIGSKEAIAAGQGYALNPQSSERFEVSASVCCTASPQSVGVLYVFTEEIAAPS